MAVISQKTGIKQQIKVNSTTSSRKGQHKHNHQNHYNKHEIKLGGWGDDTRTHPNKPTTNEMISEGVNKKPEGY